MYDETALILGYNAKDDTDQFVSFTTKENVGGTISFANAFWADGFEFQFAFDEGKDNLESFTVTLTDIYDTTQSVSFSISKYDENNSLVTYNGQTAFMSGGYYSSSPLLLALKSGYLVDYKDNRLFDMRDVTNFSTRKVWVDITLNGVTDVSTIKLKKIGQQGLLANYSSKGEIRTFRDQLLPSIEVNESVIGSAKFGSQVKIPNATAYDLYTPYMEVTYTLLTPSGVEYTGTAGDNEFFIADEFGCYELMYEAKDASKQRRTRNYQIYVFDEFAPLIDYTGKTEYTCKVGETITFDSAKVYDSTDEEPALYVFVLELNAKMIAITDTMQYTFTEKGTYKVRYYAEDANDNFDIVEITVYVK